MTPWRQLFAILAALMVVLPHGESHAQAGGGSRSNVPRRIVSLIPATTEMLFAIGAGARIVGVSNYDTFPPQVAAIEKVGGLVDPDVERLLALKPDLVIVYSSQSALKAQLERVAIPTYEYVHKGLPDIAGTMRALGARIGMPAEADRAAAQLEASLADIREKVAGRPRPRTLLVFGREPGTLRQINASGGYGFLHDILEIAGGQNVLGDLRRESVMMSTEMVLTRAPEVILELHYGESISQDAARREQRVWDALPAVPAVRNRKVFLLTGNEFVVPGPRVAIAAATMARTLHEGVFER
jgi:iron complex transport system substrate-binding protein